MKFSLGKFQALILVFSQALVIQQLFFPLVILNSIRYLPKVLNDKKIIMGIFLIIFAIISLLMRDAPIELTINLLRFYCGIILVYAAFYINKNLQITSISFFLFSAFIFYEYIFLLLGITPFSYANFTNSGIESEIKGRVSLGGNVVRTFGPSMNSSVSGTILAIMIFYILIGGKKFLVFKRNNTLLLVSLSIAFLLCGSMTAIIIFIFLLFVYLASGRKFSNLRFGLNSLSTLLAIPLLIIIFLIMQYYNFSDFITALLTSKLNTDYLMFILNYKLSQILEMLDIKTLLFGAHLASSSVQSSGGDFIFLSFLYHFGLIYVIIFCVYIFYVCPAANRIFLFAALLSTMHYGTLFTLTGQAFFGALLAGSVFSNEFNRSRAKSKGSKLVQL